MENFRAIKSFVALHRPFCLKIGYATSAYCQRSDVEETSEKTGVTNMVLRYGIQIAKGK